MAVGAWQPETNFPMEAFKFREKPEWVSYPIYSGTRCCRCFGKAPHKHHQEFHLDPADAKKRHQIINLKSKWLKASLWRLQEVQDCRKHQLEPMINQPSRCCCWCHAAPASSSAQAAVLAEAGASGDAAPRQAGAPEAVPKVRYLAARS